MSRLPSDYNDTKRYSGGFNVRLNGKLIDTVFFTGYTRREAYESLVNHDGYDSGITVTVPRKAKG